MSTDNYEDLLAHFRTTLSDASRCHSLKVEPAWYGIERDLRAAVLEVEALVKERDAAIRTYKALDGVLAKTQRELAETQADLRKAQFRAEVKAQEWRDAISVIEQVRDWLGTEDDWADDLEGSWPAPIELKRILSSFSVGPEADHA